jgi:hypothetical protein
MGSGKLKGRTRPFSFFDRSCTCRRWWIDEPKRIGHESGPAKIVRKWRLPAAKESAETVGYPGEPTIREQISWLNFRFSLSETYVSFGLIVSS